MTSWWAKFTWAGVLSLVIPVVVFCWPCKSTQAASGYQVFGRVVDGKTQRGLANVEIELYYVPLASKTNDKTISATTNTDVNGQYSFDNLPGELEGDVRILEMPNGYVVPLANQVWLRTVKPTNEVIFLAGRSAVLTGTIIITNGTADLTKFTIDINATEIDATADGTFVIPEIPCTQKTTDLVYHDGHYFDQRVVQLPSMKSGETNTMKIVWHKPMHSISTEGTLRDAQGNILTNALINFLGEKTGVFVGMQTDTNGVYRIYDLPKDCYTVRAYVGRYGIEQRVLSATDSTICIGNDGKKITGSPSSPVGK